MAKTTMKAQEVRVSRAQSVAQGQQVRPSVRSRDCMAFWPAVPLYPYGRRRTLRQEVEGHGLDLRPATHYRRLLRMTVVKLEARGLLVYAPVAPTQSVSTLSRS